MLTSVKCAVHRHCHLQREMPEFIPRDVATQFAWFESGGLQHLGCPSTEGLPFADPWCAVCLLREWRLLDHFIITTAIAQWRNRFSACVHVNVEETFWTCDFLVYFIRFINTGFHKFDPYKHVQSANIAWNVSLLCPRLLHSTVATKRMYGRKFLNQVLWHSLAKLCTKKIMKIRLYL